MAKSQSTRGRPASVKAVNRTGITKRGGESYKITQTPPPSPPAPAVSSNSKKKSK
ncbi:MAG: hypothetical protein ACRDJ2_16105 [Actinomycetota bacterium]